MWRGRYMLGQRIPLTVVTRNGIGTPLQPDRCPMVRIYGDAGTLLATFRMPVQDKFGQTGLFEFVQIVDGRFPIGRLRIVYMWAINSVTFSLVDIAEVMTGGDQDGAGVSMFVLTTPVGEQVISQHESGRVIRRRNPRIA